MRANGLRIFYERGICTNVKSENCNFFGKKLSADQETLYISNALIAVAFLSTILKHITQFNFFVNIFALYIF